MSAKRTAAARIYAAKRKKFLAARPTCEVCKTRSSVDVHHTAGRAGENYCDEATFLAVCRQCHEWIHEHPSEARSRSLLK